MNMWRSNYIFSLCPRHRLTVRPLYLRGQSSYGMYGTLNWVGLMDGTRAVAKGKNHNPAIEPAASYSPTDLSCLIDNSNKYTGEVVPVLN
jgi:hypothetical protein